MIRFRIPVLALLAAALVVLLAAAAAAVPTVFRYEPPAGEDPSAVSLRGQMNGWGETPMARGDDGTWSVTVELDPGEYAYKFFVDGNWPQNMETDAAGGPLDAGADKYIDDGFGGQNAVRVVGGAGGAAADAPAADVKPAPALRAGYARIHYHRPDGRYSGWGLHVWEQTTESVQWNAPLKPVGQDEYGIWWDVGLADGATKVGFLIHRGDEKDPGVDQFLDPSRQREVWIASGREDVYAAPPDVEAMARGDLTKSRAQWLTRDALVWDARLPDGAVVRLHAAPLGGLTLEADGVAGAAPAVELTRAEALSGKLRDRFPHLASYAVYHLPADAMDLLPELLRSQLAVSATDADGKLRDASGVQIAGVLDDLYAWDGPLGPTWTDGAPTLRVWAPTARSVRLLLYDGPRTERPTDVVTMQRIGGTWSAAGSADWKNRYYLYEVVVWAPSTGRMETNLVTDPYSRSLSRNSERSQFVDLDDPALMPAGWDAVVKPNLAAPEDIVLYELHVRDFSAFDEKVPDAHRGTFLAFADEGHGRAHLRKLADAGLTHVHLLPAFDIATVNEDRAAWKSPEELTKFAPDSQEQQARVAAVQGEDGFNWGYDPYHYGVPEGSYATDPDGPARITEFRRMVQALSELGLRVVMDVVYNHTHASGQDPRSVLDRIVPGYYHRLNADGRVENSTCCANTATEHAMMERLMVDDLVHWAKDYKVDGFRFDLMGHHMKRNMTAARKRLRALTPETDGVDGSAICLYGEGWDFGEVGGGARGPNATQPAMAGTGIATFNDRLRDAVRGGNPFGDRREQGFATGLATAPSAWSVSSGPHDADAARAAMDRVRTGLAGNLRDFTFTGRSGIRTRGGEHDNGGYGADPEDSVQYASAHDNETLFDKVQLCAPADAKLAERVRMHRLALGTVAFSQGIPFFHAGSELLRSKSMDRDSYDSGDWFNRLDFSYARTGWGSGLPVADKNADRWPVMKPLLAEKKLAPGRTEIEETARVFEDFLRIRRSSPLFRMREAREIQARLRFENTGPNQTPGLIVMSLNDRVPGPPDADPVREELVVVFNATPETKEWTSMGRAGMAGRLHPVQANGADPVARGASYDAATGTFRVPAWTAAVFEFPE